VKVLAVREKRKIYVKRETQWPKEKEEKDK
jgi:hypothetical protein